jgi:hypothetical protein
MSSTRHEVLVLITDEMRLDAALRHDAKPAERAIAIADRLDKMGFDTASDTIPDLARRKASRSVLDDNGRLKIVLLRSDVEAAHKLLAGLTAPAKLPNDAERPRVNITDDDTPQAVLMALCVDGLIDRNGQYTGLAAVHLTPGSNTGVAYLDMAKIDLDRPSLPVIHNALEKVIAHSRDTLVNYDIRNEKAHARNAGRER